MTALDFGSLNDHLAENRPGENLERSIDQNFRSEFADAFPDEALPITPASGLVRNVLRSAGPISDAYILAHNPADLITGPGGSGKTTASAKKMLVEAQRIYPGPNGVRRYVLGAWRQKYVNLWNATIPSYWSVLPKDLAGSTWSGAPPRNATHVVNFEDGHGLVQLIVMFRAFGESMNPEDLLGNQFTDCYFNEWTTLPEELFIGLVDRVGRDPPPEIIRRPGRFYGDANAPDVLNYVYRDWYEEPKPGYVLHRQPGGLDQGAENLEAMGRGYYENSARMNAHRPWWVRRMVHNKPGMNRAGDPVYPTFDDERNMSAAPLEPIKGLPMLVGIDGGLTPAAVYGQERGDGQLRIYAEIGLERGGMRELATAMLALEAAQFPDFEDFSDTCDPSMAAGEDTEEGSDRSRLSTYLGRHVELARTNNPDDRWDSIRVKINLTVEAGQPGLTIDPRCKGLRRGFSQTYAFRRIQGTNDRGQVAKTFDSHVHDALQCVGLQCGTDRARRRTAERHRALREKREQARAAPRYNPLRRWSARNR